jgi:hypothetical protein
MDKDKLIKIISLATILTSSTALAGVTPVDPFNGVSSVTISPQHSYGAGDLTGSNYGYANGLEQFAYKININYAGAVSDDQINVDFMEGLTIDIDVPDQGGIKHMHLKMPTSSDTCLNQGEYIYPGSKYQETTFPQASYNGLLGQYQDFLPKPQGNNWQCSNNQEDNCTLFYNSQDVIGGMNDPDKARICLSTIKNEFRDGVDNGSSLNSTPTFNNFTTSSKETKIIYIQAADIPEGAYVIGLTYTDDNNHTIVVNENSGAEYLNIRKKPRLTITPNICYKNSTNYGKTHHEHPGLEYRDYYISNPNPNSSIQYMPIFMNVKERTAIHINSGSHIPVWGYADITKSYVIYRYDEYNRSASNGSGQVVLNKSFSDDRDMAEFVTQSYPKGKNIGTGGAGHYMGDDQYYVAYTAKNIITNSIYPNQNYIKLIFWGSMDSDDATNNDQNTMPQIATAIISMDQFGNTYQFENQSLLTSCIQ